MEASTTSPPAERPVTALTVTEALRRTAAEHPDLVAFRTRDDSVSLTWTYPKNAEGPVLISGGRQGTTQRACQQLAAGTGNYVVYGLDEQTNYCFTVAVVYTVNDVAASPQLCTNRK